MKKRTALVGAFVQPDEARRARIRAAQEGLTLSTWMYRLMLEALSKPSTAQAATTT